MQLHNVKPIHRAKNKKRVGRGGKRGTYSGKGIKGQKSRAGHKIRPEIRDFIKKIPKQRGYRFKSFRSKPAIVNLKDLNEKFNDGDTINPKALLNKGLIVKVKGRMPEVKILCVGELKKKLKFEGCKISQTAEKFLKTEKTKQI